MVIFFYMIMLVYCYKSCCGASKPFSAWGSHGLEFQRLEFVFKATCRALIYYMQVRDAVESSPAW